mgnify:FL=1
MTDITLSAPKQGHGSGHGAGHVHFIIAEHRAKVGDPHDGKFLPQNAHGIIIGHKQKFVFAQAAGYRQSPHGVSVPCAVYAVKNASHFLPPAKKHTFAFLFYLEENRPSNDLRPLRRALHNMYTIVYFLNTLSKKPPKIYT